MERATAEVPCPDCGVTGEASDPGLDRWNCAQCGRMFFIRRCSVCGLAGHVGGLQGWHQPWQCVWCRATNTGFTQNNDPAAATVGDLAEDVAGHHLAFAPPAHLAGPEQPPAHLAGPEPQPAGVLPDDGLLAERGTDAAQPTVPDPGQVTVPGQAVTPGAGQAAAQGPGRAAMRGPGDDTAPLSGRPMAASPPVRPWRLRVFAALTVAAIMVLAVLIALANRGGPGAGPVPAGRQAAGRAQTAGGAQAAGGAQTAGGSGPAGGGGRAVSVSAAAVGTVDLQAVPGLLTIVGTSADRVTLTGHLRWKGRAPAAMNRFDHATGVLLLSYRCAPGSPCSGNYRLAVPDNTATALRLPFGRLVLSGVGGPVTITAASVNVTATGLHSPTLAVAITSGRLTASFTLPPRRISIALTSAQAILRLPGSVAYRISQHVSSGSVNVAVPHARTAANTVTAFLRASDLKLLSGT